MENNLIKIVVNNNLIECKNGESLYKVLTENGIYTSSFCGGNGTCGKCKVTVDGRETLSCRTACYDNMTVELRGENENIQTKSGIEQTHNLKGSPLFCLDIGTTTLALALVDSAEKSVAEVFASNNPQRKYGADVISRIGYCSGGGLNNLHTCLIDEINSLLNKAYKKYGINSAEKLFVAGNTVMTHLFLNVDCSSMGAAPYTPAFLEAKKVSGGDLNLNGISNVYTLPCFASFVGGDIAAGIYDVKIPEDNKYALLIDLGTNAEIALFSKDVIYCTSAAAGPCFEGANITCGMSALSGAVSSFKLLNGEKTVETVNNAPAIGICGTGLIDIIAELLAAEEIDETGYLECEEPFNIANDVYLHQKDIREFQTAKSAVKSAAEILIDKAEITFDDIEALYISGGFSSFINVENAGICGLLPLALLKKCRAIENSSLGGTVKYALGNFNPESLMAAVRYIDLTTDPDFSEKFVENISFE